MKVLNYDNVELKVFETREEMGLVAAREAIECIKELLAKKDEINCIFAAAPSQNDFLNSLITSNEVEWKRINAFHMDEYIGFEIGDSRSFTGFLNEKIFERVPFKSVNLLNGMADPSEECGRYSKLLKEKDIDIVFMGIGENGHIAFNDPSVADFNDTEVVKVVELEESCRIQQVNDGCFPTMDDVPKKALTLTIPTLINCEAIFCIVPTINKAAAVEAALKGDISEKCPASILRTVKNVRMYIDGPCASRL